MSNLPGNPFEVNAQDDPGNMGGTTANALLALAYEQRTANLIALWGQPDSMAITGLDYEAVREGIRERLGMGAGE